ncbi:MAG: toll/interleukin-1 receptor domain-containing protein [Candidatus Binatia bacterium]
MKQKIASLMSWLWQGVDLLFGFDFFVSYAHADGMHYPQTITERLRQAGFRVFLDAHGYVAGDDLPVATRRRVRMSRYLVLILRPAALRSQWVLTEVQQCLAAKRIPIAINVNQTFEHAPTDCAIKPLLQERIFIVETVDSIDGNPSSRTVESLIRSFKATRQDVVRFRVIGAAVVVFLAAAVAALWQYRVAENRAWQAQEQRALRSVAMAERLIFQNPPQALVLAARGLSESDSETAIDAATTAIHRALVVIQKRQEIQDDRLWGVNVFQPYIAGTWFKAQLQARYNNAGNLLLLATERGESGANPPGEAFLLETETLEMKELDVPSRSGLKRRLEFLGFGETGKKIYLARQYNVEVYSVAGVFDREFKTGGGCTKYPISLVTGVLDDRLIVYGDADGAVYTLDYATGDCHRLSRKPEQILIQFALSSSGRLAAMLFKDQTATLWSIAETSGLRKLFDIEVGKVSSVLFHPQAEQQILTGGDDGQVALWEIHDRELRQLRTYQHAGLPIRFLAFSLDGERVIAVDHENGIYIWESSTGNVVRSIRGELVEVQGPTKKG